MMFHLDVGNNDDGVYGLRDVTDVSYDIMTYVYACCISQGIIKILFKERLMILMSLCFKFTGVHVCQNYPIEHGLTKLSQK